MHGPLIQEVELEFQSGICSHNGEPFTGIAVSQFSDGQRRTETPYENGWRQGECKSWYPNGQLRELWHANDNVCHGTRTAWYPTGNLKVRGLYEFGSVIEVETWDESGSVATTYHNDARIRAMRDWAERGKHWMAARRKPEFDVNIAEATRIQANLAKAVERYDVLAPRIQHVAGVDVAYAKGDDARVYAGVVIINCETMETIETATATGVATFPYTPGLFAFRELPPLWTALEKIHNKPELLICDGQGIAHFRRCGLASHLGVLLDVPTIGCGKTRLLGEYDEPGPQRGASSLLTDAGEVIGSVLRTQDSVKPLFVSIGHRVSLQTAEQWILRLANQYRQPEPIRRANELVCRLRTDDTGAN